jgi:TolB-like protein/DNA-binding winged helix-turn-helix (wHTH) protein/Flp pilus assembly protein TadD
MAAVGPARTLRFGVFEIDLHTGELTKAGRKLSIQERPARVLVALLEHPGEVVSREELQRKVWQADTFVDFDTGINKAIAKIREALSDSADSPRFVETLPRRGYRFIAPVQNMPDFVAGTAPEPAPAAISSTAEVVHEAIAPAAKLSGWRRRWMLATMLAFVLLAVVALWAWKSRDQTRPPIRSIAVLPLQNLSGDPGQEYFADGMTDELITDLAQIHSLRVISHTSVMQFKQTKKKLSEIANDLNVDAVVEGSVFQSNGNVRVTAQLLDARMDRHLWAASYERQLGDVVGLQRQVAQSITDQVRAELTPLERANLKRQRQTNPEAYQAMLKGLFYSNQKTPEAVEKAILYYKQAVEIDPRNAEAWAGLGGCYASLGAEVGVFSRSEVLPNARAAVEKALAIDDGLGSAHRELGRIKLWFDWDWKGAESEIRRAIELNPNDASAHNLYSLYLAFAKRFDEAVAENQRAIDLAPLDPLPSVQLAWLYTEARRPDKALEQCRRVLAMERGFLVPYFYIGISYEQQRKWPEAIAAYEKLKDIYKLGYLVGIGHAWAASGHRAEAESALAQLQELSKQMYVSPVFFAAIYSALGEPQTALEWLERGYRERATSMIGLHVNPWLDDLRPDPRFQNLLGRIGFP